MTIDLSRISDSEPNQPLKWLGGALETPIRGHEWTEQASEASNRGTQMRRTRFFGASKNRKSKNAQNEILDVRC